MKKIKLLLILLFIFIGVNKVYAFDNTLKIYDYAQELTNQQEQELSKLANQYVDTYNMDMVLVTVKSHQKDTTKEYAMDFYDYHEFGIGSTHDGIIFVIDFTFGHRDIEIVTTGEAIRMYDDYRINNMLDNISDISDEEYYNWFKTFINDASNYANDDIPDSNIDTSIDSNGDLNYTTKGSLKNLPWLYIIIIPAIIATIIIVIFILKNKMVKKGIYASYYLKENSKVITSRNDRFITTHTTSVRINDSSSSSTGGGHIGGSSISRGSSGISHGGGGRRL